MGRKRGPSVSWFVLLAVFLPIMVFAVLGAFYPSGLGGLILVGSFGLYLVTLAVGGIVYVVHRDES
jgi:hypothetical protein